MNVERQGEDSVELLGESDWDEQDLLTIAEASERLESEITTLRAAIDAQSDTVERNALSARLSAMQRVYESIRRGPSPLAKVTPNY